MTLITYKDGIMAGDSAASLHNKERTMVVGHLKKVYKNNDGWLCGCCGSSYDIQKFEQWFMQGREGQLLRIKNMSALVVSPSGAMFMYTDEFRMDPFQMAGKYHALGVGSDFAMGCMAAGASAVRAVRLTMVSIPTINGRVHSETLTASGKKAIPFIES